MSTSHTMRRCIAVFAYLAFFIDGNSTRELDGPAIYRLTEAVDHAEGPTWDERTGRLYYVDIFTGTILSYHLKSGRLTSACLNGDVTPIVPSRTRTDLFVVGLNRSVVLLEWDGENQIGDTKIVTTISNHFPTSRFNDGKADPTGRLWFGTMGFESSAGVKPNEGVLYKITRENAANPTPVIAPVNISNGLTWNKANDKFYYIDTPTLRVKQYDYEDREGSISNPKVVFDVSDHASLTGFPDGMTIDQDDKLWIALYNGGSVVQVDPTNGSLLRQLSLPARDVTSVMWGGPNYDLLFVTTSRHHLDATQRKWMPAAGSLFAIANLGTRGFPVHTADVEI